MSHPHSDDPRDLSVGMAPALAPDFWDEAPESEIADVLPPIDSLSVEERAELVQMINGQRQDIYREQQKYASAMQNDVPDPPAVFTDNDLEDA